MQILKFIKGPFRIIPGVVFLYIIDILTVLLYLEIKKLCQYENLGGGKVFFFIIIIVYVLIT